MFKKLSIVLAKISRIISDFLNWMNRERFASLLLMGIIVLGTSILSRQFFPDEHHGEHKEHAYKWVESAPVEIADNTPKGPEPIEALLATADVAAGEVLHKKCLTCHSFEKGGPNKVGPHLWDVVNREKAHVTDYAYSDALRAKGGTWSYDSLNQFLYQAKVYIPGTKMNFAGFKTAQERANIIAYMRTLSDSPAPLPEPAK